MASTNFVDGQTVILAAWLNDANASVYQGLFGQTLSYVDTGTVGSFASTVAGYNQLIVQNKSNASNASANFNVSNDAASATTNYVEMGINSSTFTGTGSFSQAGNAYVASASTDLVLGTYGSKAVRFVVNSGAADAMVITASNTVGIGATPPTNTSFLLTSGGSIAVVPSYAGYTVNAQYDGAWKYIGAGLAWGIGNNYGGAANSFTIAMAPVATAGAALTWVPALNVDTSGNVTLQAPTGGLGYGTGSGGPVTQFTSRTTPVTLNRPTGQVTLFTAAPTVGAWLSFNIVNSLVTANDTVVVSVTGASNTYVATSSVGAGAILVSFMSINGTASDAPKINFAIIKGAAS